MSAAAHAADPTTISFWARDSQAAFAQKLVDGYNASQDKIKVKLTLVPFQSFPQKFGAAAAADSSPDVASLDLIAVPYFAENNTLLDITDRANSLPYIDQFDQAHISLSKWNDKFYALPFSAEASVLYYNKDLFKAAGLDPEKPPTTWDEIRAYAKKITALGNGTYGYYLSGGCAGCNLFVVSPYLYAAGSDVLTGGPAATNVDVNASSSVAALSFLNGLAKDGSIPPDAKADTGANFYSAFSTGKIGMQGGGAFGVNDLIQSKKVDFGVTLLPGPTAGTSGSFSGGDTIVIPAGSHHVDEAWDFIKWATGDDAQRHFIADLGITPVRTDIASSYYAAKDPRYAVLAAALKLGKTSKTIHANELFTDESGPWLALLQGAIFGDDPKAAADAAQAKFLDIVNGN
jgi:multiple sugar transport system substrate-binding protein